MPNVFTLDMNTPSVQYLCEKDKRLARVINMVGPISYVLHEKDAYAFLIHEIIEQVLSVKAGKKIYERLEGLCDGKVTPKRIIALSDHEIRGTGISFSKARCIHSVTEAVLCGDLDFDKMDALSDEEIICALTKFHGIGNWTAKMFLIFVLNRPDVLPFEDGAFLQTYRWVYKTKDSSEKAVRKKCRKWKPYSSIASRFFYRALDDGLTKKEFHLFKQEGTHMATKGNKKTNYEANEAFLQYEEEIATHPAYAGMPDLRHEDGTIQWETPSNRGSGIFQFSHDKRYQWWVRKAKKIGISTDEDKWISKVAKTIHPTKLHPCKVCGRVMDIRYCYLSSNFIKRVQKLSFYDGSVELEETTHILDFVSSFVDTYGDIAYDSLPRLLKCSQVKEFPNIPHDLSAWTEWIEQRYIPKEPGMLSPGVMSNAPDRLDGFHTFNRCCRSTADKGRSKENLASYSSDRRAFENWSDGNWITANKLMGFINSNSSMKKELCANEGNGKIHPRPCSADHIGPISLGFCHRPEFQLLCKPCNSAKNNRMYYSDVRHLIEVEKKGETVVTWYANSIWQKCKEKVTDKESALRLYRVMRDNRNVAMMLLAEFMEKNEFLFLLTLLNLEYADYSYDIIPESVKINHQIVTVDFSRKVSTLRYVNIQKTRKIRVAFSALSEYAKKENRNGYTYTNAKIESLKTQAFSILSNISDNMKGLNDALIAALSDEERVDAEIGAFLSTINYSTLKKIREFIEVRMLLQHIMELVAQEISSNWDDPRYSRETADE